MEITPLEEEGERGGREGGWREEKGGREGGRDSFNNKKIIINNNNNEWGEWQLVLCNKDTSNGRSRWWW